MLMARNAEAITTLSNLHWHLPAGIFLSILLRLNLNYVVWACDGAAVYGQVSSVCVLGCPCLRHMIIRVRKDLKPCRLLVPCWVLIINRMYHYVRSCTSSFSRLCSDFGIPNSIYSSALLVGIHPLLAIVLDSNR